MTKPNQIIKIGEVATLLGVHVNTIRRWEREGKIKPKVRFQGKGTRYYDKEEILALGQQGEFKTRAEIEDELGPVMDWALGEPRYDAEYVRRMWSEFQNSQIE